MSIEPLQPGAAPAPGYEVIAHLSRGRRLDVYDAWSEERGCRCVLKVLRPERAQEKTARALLAREGNLLKALSHPYLVRGYGTMAEPLPMIVLETLGGQTLAHMIEVERRELSAPELAQLGLQLGSVVRYLHRNGFLHLDLKPSNVVADAGRAKLIDLSLARPPGSAPAGIGTWCYLAPEQAAGGELGAAADVWGLGVVLFEAATLQPAFDDEDPLDGSQPSAGTSDDRDSLSEDSETWRSDDRANVEFPQLEADPPAVGSLRDLPKGLGGLIDACLRRDPNDRPTVDGALAALESITDVPREERRWSAGDGEAVALSPGSEP